MIHLVYVSSATSWPSEENLISLLEQARNNNRKMNITGMLLYDNATYLQVLEGEAPEVHKIFSSIQKDSRNIGVVKLIEESIVERDFPSWSMGFRNLTICKPEELPGFNEIFKGKLDKDLALKNKVLTIELVLNFSRKR